MIPVDLAIIKTRDGLALDGIVVRPKRKGKIPRHYVPGSRRQSRLGTALIWLHGLSSKFYSGSTLIRELSRRCSQNKIGYFKFNTRGHDIVTREAATKAGFGGTAFEKFEDCIFDIRAIINFARRLGFRNIILAGHSTGANKALYYIYKTRDRSVKGLMLVGPLNDILSESQRIGRTKLRKAVTIAGKLKKKNPLALMPIQFGIWTSRRYWSLYHPGEREDVFPYSNPRARWKELKSVRVPVAVIISSRDEHLDRPVKNLIEIFRSKTSSTKSFSGIIIKGARHSLHRKEKELATDFPYIT